MEFRSQAGKAWSRVLIHRTMESTSMSPVLRLGPSRKIHTQESFFWFRKRGNIRNGADGISDMPWIPTGERSGLLTRIAPDVKLLSQTEPKPTAFHHWRKSPLDSYVWTTAPESSNKRIIARRKRERERYFAYATASWTASGPAYQIR